MIETIYLKDKETGLLLLRPCLEIMIFSDLSLKEGAEEYFLAYQNIISYIPGSLKHYITNDMHREKKLTCSPEEQIKLVLVDKKAISSTFFMVEQHSGVTQDDYALPSFSLLSEKEKLPSKKIRDHVLFRICLNPEQVSIVPEMLQKVLQHFPLSTGYCMYSYYYNVGNVDCIDYIEQHNAYWLKRFPGLSHGNPLQFLLAGNDGLLQVGWLTMLGEKFTCNPENMDNLTVNLPKGAEKIDVPGTGRFIIKAGCVPELGDRNQQNDLSLYKSVGKALTNLRLPDSLLNEISIDGLEDEEVREWLLRFFGDETD